MNIAALTLVAITTVIATMAQAQTSLRINGVGKSKALREQIYFQRDSQGQLLIDSKQPLRVGIFEINSENYSPEMSFTISKDVLLSFDQNDRLHLALKKTPNVRIELGKIHFRHGKDEADFCMSLKPESMTEFSCEMKIELNNNLRMQMKVKAGSKYPKLGGNDPFDFAFYRKLNATVKFSNSDGHELTLKSQTLELPANYPEAKTQTYNH